MVMAAGPICGDFDLASLPAGDNPGIFVVGSEAELASLYQQLSQSSTPVQLQNYNGTAVELSRRYHRLGCDPTRQVKGVRSKSTRMAFTYRIHIGQP
jgi:hypothetical protein